MATLTMVVISLACVLILFYVFRRPMLRCVGGMLIAEDPATDYDAIVILNGGMSTRPYRARELYRQRPAPVLLARLADTEEVRLGIIPNISEATGDLLQRIGVDREHICVVRSQRWVAGTRDEAVILCPLIRERGHRKIALVTDAFHTRRARRIFRDVTSDGSIEYLAVSSRFTAALKDNWWRSQYGLVQVFTEYLKCAHYFYIKWRPRGPLPAVESDLPPADEVRRLVTGMEKD